MGLNASSAPCLCLKQAALSSPVPFYDSTLSNRWWPVQLHWGALPNALLPFKQRRMHVSSCTMAVIKVAPAALLVEQREIGTTCLLLM
jgi:hypothetical protein